MKTGNSEGARQYLRSLSQGHVFLPVNLQELGLGTLKTSYFPSWKVKTLTTASLGGICRYNF